MTPSDACWAVRNASSALPPFHDPGKTIEPAALRELQPHTDTRAAPRTFPWRDAGIALSLANLLYLRQWSWILNPIKGYHRVEPPPWSAGAGAVLGVFLLAALFLFAARALRRCRYRRVAREVLTLSFLAAFLVVLNAGRQQTTGLAFARIEPLAGGRTLGAITGMALGLGAFLLIRWRRRAARAVLVVTLWLLPFTVFTFGQALEQIVRDRREAPEYEDPPAASFLERSARAPRLVVVVFDNLGQSEVFDARPDGVELPAFDRLRQSSVECTNAYPPSYSTSLSLASLTTGRQVVDAQFAGPRDLQIRFESERGTSSWARVDNLFSQVRALGVNSAVVGWFHPYCRLFGSSLVSCHFQAFLPEPDYSLSADLRRQASSLVDVLPGAIRVGLSARLGLLDPTPDPRRWHLGIYQAIQREAALATGDPRLGLVFIHYPIPHDPYIYDRQRRRFDTVGASGFLDNLALADVALGGLRHSLEKAGLCESSTVIVTTDHWNRNQDDPLARSRFPVIGHRIHRVPFLIKLAGQTSRVEFSGVFRTRDVHDLALAILRGELATPASVTSWLTRRTGTPPPPGDGAGAP